jgi:uncharacterized protein (DUF433 family)
MATAAKTVYSHITKDPQVRGGRACIDRSRVAVVDVVFWHKEGHSPEQILAAYPSLSLEQLYAALSYYYGHQAEVEAELAEDEGWDEAHEAAKVKHLARRSPR